MAEPADRITGPPTLEERLRWANARVRSLRKRLSLSPGDRVLALALASQLRERETIEDLLRRQGPRPRRGGSGGTELRAGGGR